MSSQRTLTILAAGVLGVLGALAIAAGIIYLVLEAKSLPSFMGQIRGDTAHRSLRGIVALIVGVLVVAAGVALFAHQPSSEET